MNKIMRVCPILFALACAACNGTGSKQEGGFGQPPPEDTTVPTGPLHIAFEGIYDAHIPVNEQDTYLNYSCVNEPCGASLYVKVPVQSPVHVGISGAYWPSSGNETVPADRLVTILASVEGKAVPFDDVNIEMSSDGISIHGSATIDGVSRKILLEGPIYRVCSRPGPPPDWAPPEDDSGVWQGGVAPPSVWVDPDFGSADCAPFK